MAWKGYDQKWIVYIQYFYLCNEEFQKSSTLRIPEEDYAYQVEER